MDSHRKQHNTKVLNISEEGRGGGALYRIVMTAVTCRDDIDTVVVLPKIATKFIDMMKERDIRYHAITLHPLTTAPIGLLKFLLWFMPEVIMLVRIIKREQPDIIHANGSWQYKAIIAARITQTHCIWHMNDMWQPSIVEWVFRQISKLPTHYIFASERTRSYYTGLSNHISNKQSTVIQAPVDISRYTLPRPALPTQPPYQIINVGYINAHKGLEDFLRVASLMGVDYQFSQVGAVLGSRQSYYDSVMSVGQELDVNNVVWCGHSDDVPRLLSEMTIYLCTSRREASPMAVWEALAAGLPIVSTDVGDVKHIVDEYHCGVVVPVGDVSGMAQAITSIIADQARYAELSLNARRAASAVFAIEAVCKRYIHFINTQLSK